MKTRILLVSLLLPLILLPTPFVEAFAADSLTKASANSLLGEKLTYKVSFLWFKKIALAEISFETGEKKGTYLATLTAKTRGMAAFFTRNRVETFTTLMEEGPAGLLRPLLQVSDTKKGKGKKTTHRLTSYTYDYDTNQVGYSKTINGIAQHKYMLPMVNDKPTYDFLTAFYNLRLGRLGAVEPGHDIKLSAFSRKGPEEIIISRLVEEEQQRLKFPMGLLLCKVLMSPDTFKTKGRDVYVGFDSQLRPKLAVIKNVIGLGDVHGELVHVTEPRRVPRNTP